jgi:outer membrane immunogenic protein
MMKFFQVTGAGLLALMAAATPTLSADIPVKARPAPASATVTSFDWSGFYAGATAGYGWDRSQLCEPGLGCSDSYDITGLIGGGTLGYNWQTGGWLFGFEGDISYAGIEGLGPSSAVCTSGCRTEVEWFATLRGRAGAAFDRLLLFVTGGLAAAHMEAGFVGLSPAPTTKTGWTLGAGLEWAFAPNWSTKLEYLHIGGLGAFNVAGDCGGTGCFAPRSSFDVVRVGLNYRFATGKSPAPVVTKY